MTKEDLLAKEGTDGVGGVFFDWDVKEFLGSNVCIPIGETLQVNFAGGWDDAITINHHCEYRIKPSDLVYEYQYVLYDKDKEIARSSFLTEHEYDISCLSFEWLIDIKSKRVRE